VQSMQGLSEYFISEGKGFPSSSTTVCDGGAMSVMG